MFDCLSRSPIYRAENCQKNPTPRFQKKENREPKDSPPLGQIWNQFPQDSLGCHTPAPHALVSRSKGKEKNADIFQKDLETPRNCQKSLGFSINAVY